MSERRRPPGPEPVTRPRLYEQVAEQILDWVHAEGLGEGDRLPAERELAAQLGVSRTTLAQALVGMEVAGLVKVQHGHGTVLTGVGGENLARLLRDRADDMADIMEARDALESRLAALAAVRRTEADLAAIDASLVFMAEQIERGERGVEGDERFHAAVTAAGHAPLLERLMTEISELIRRTRVRSLEQPNRPARSLADHREVADAIRQGDPQRAAAAMSEHIALVSDVVDATKA